jgi:hypothetical protein
MPRRRKRALHFNLAPQDPIVGGKNVQYHNEHRSKRGRRYQRNVSLKYFLYKKAKKETVLDE